MTNDYVLQIIKMLMAFSHLTVATFNIMGLLNHNTGSLEASQREYSTLKTL